MLNSNLFDLFWLILASLKIWWLKILSCWILSIPSNICRPNLFSSWFPVIVHANTISRLSLLTSFPIYLAIFISNILLFPKMILILSDLLGAVPPRSTAVILSLCLFTMPNWLYDTLNSVPLALSNYWRVIYTLINL